MIVQGGEDIQVIKTMKDSFVSKIHLINASFNLWMQLLGLFSGSRCRHLDALR